MTGSSPIGEPPRSFNVSGGGGGGDEGGCIIAIILIIVIGIVIYNVFF